MLIVSVVLLKRVVEVTIEPEELGHDTKVERHLRVIIGLVVVSSADGVDFLVQVRMNQ